MNDSDVDQLLTPDDAAGRSRVDERVGRALRAHSPNFTLGDLNQLPNLTREEQEILEQGPPSWRKAKMPGLTEDDQ